MSYLEIQNLLKEELKTSSQYAEVLLIKQFIIQKINEPAIVSMRILYTFSVPFTNEDDKELFKLCFKNEFSFIEENMNEYQINIDLSKFLI
jgi:hypothetical protein